LSTLQKLGIFLLVALCVVVLTYFFIGRAPPELVVTCQKRTHGKAGTYLCVGYGWSTKGDAVEAVREAVAMLREGMGDNEPEFVFLFCSCKYDEEAVLREVSRELPKAKIYGGTSCLGVLTPDGFHTSENGALAVMGIHSSKLTFGVGGASLKDFLPEEAAKNALRQALEDAGKPDQIPDLILITAAPGKEEEILRGIDNLTGGRVPVIGGSSADDEIKGEWKQFANRVYTDGVALTVIFSELRFGWAYEAGYYLTKENGVVTNAAGRIIYEINGEPAAEIYNRWTGGILGSKMQTGGTVLHETTFWPLARVLKGREGETHVISIHPLSVNAKDHSLSVFANLENGEKIALMHGTWEILLNRAFSTPSRALESFNLSKDELGFALYTYCAGTMLAIPENERHLMPQLLRNAIGETPLIGTFTFGEQGYLEGVGNVHGNLVNSIVIFSDKIC
jgi:hypothetical protein